MSDTFEQAARDYLQEELGARAPHSLVRAGSFAEQPLDGEGDAAVFSFDLDAPPSACADPGGTDPGHYVVVGQTTPNYYPAYGLDADDAYSLHIGTRFMLVVGVALVDAALEPAEARDRVIGFVRTYNPDAPIEGVELAALFQCEEDLYGVYAIAVGGRRVYGFGADCPPGFSELTRHPPQVALRLHLGRLIRAEARVDAGREPGDAPAAKT